MKIIDISQEVLSCQVYPGDRGPKAIPERRISDGELYNLSSFEMCAHNGTHIDAPFHFLEDGKTVDELPPEKLIGWCTVLAFEGVMGREDAQGLLRKAREPGSGAAGKLLFKGRAVISEAAAEVFAESGMELIGVELQSVGPEDAPMAVHKLLLEKEICLLEGIRLSQVAEGVYFLHAAPLSLAGFDGSPCRATLTTF